MARTYREAGVNLDEARRAVELIGQAAARTTTPEVLSGVGGFGSLFRHNVRLAGGPAPVRAYIEELMPDILDGTIEPGKVFDTTTINLAVRCS